MTDVFLSYAREDRGRAEKLAAVLQVRGLSVWWDRKIAAGASFDQAIERELETAKRIVVLWSENSVTSEWVRNEASAAAERGVLVPALIDRVKLPFEFRRRQTIDLVGWDGDSSHEGIAELFHSISASDAARPTPEPAVSLTRKFSWDRRWTSAAIAATALVVLIGAYLLGVLPNRGSLSNPQPSITGLWRHRTGVFLVIRQDGNSIAVEQHDPERGVTATGTGVLKGSELPVKLVYKADGGTADGKFTISADEQQLSWEYTGEASGSKEPIVFRR